MKTDIFKCFLQIVYKEIIIFIKMLKSRLIDVFIITATTILVFAYIMPAFGMQTNYGSFIFVGLIPAVSLFEVIPKASLLVADITGAKKISYMLTLPISSWLIFIAIAVGWAATTAMLTIFMLPVGKLFLLSKLDLSNISLWRFVIIFVTGNLFFGFFALWLTGTIKDMKYVAWVWTRVVNPMFMFGCYFYSWFSVYNVSHLAGYVNLLNPFIYAVEGLRTAVLGPKGNIPFGLCVAVLWVFILLLGYHAVKRLKKKLDCV